MRGGKTGPDPVSCQSCRTKKLKCNRVHPCSNCTSRGIFCTFPARARAQRQQRITETPVTTTLESSNGDLLKRVDRLEAFLLRSNPNHATNHTWDNSDDSLLGMQPPQQPALTPVSFEPTPPATIRQDTNSDLEYLENVGTGRGSSLVRFLQYQYPKE